MSNQSVLSAQWSLNESSNSVLAMTRGLIKAATSDNIQPLALMACEQFGTTLPMSIETRLKMEKIARKKHSTTLDFIKCQVGFSEGDSANYLSRTDGGVRFLGLAATLYLLRNPIHAAQLLESMVQETAKDKQLLPTLLQYKSLLDALEPKLASSDFANSMLGWATVCSAVKDRPSNSSFYKAPGISQIQGLMQALARCFRIGEECTVHIESAFILFPWTIAFVKWFTGVPPYVRTTKEVLLSVPDPLVVISEEELGSSDSTLPFRVSLIRKVDNIRVLIHQNSTTTCLSLSGLVDVDVWMEHHISNYEQTFRTGPNFRNVVQQSLWLILEILPERVVFRSIPNISVSQPEIQKKILGDDKHGLLSCRTYPFANLEKRLLAARYLLKDKVIPRNAIYSHECWRNEVRSICTECPRCTRQLTSEAGYNRSYLSQGLPHSPSCYIGFIGGIAADLLALCLIICNKDSPTPKVQLRRMDLSLGHISDYGRYWEDNCFDPFCEHGPSWADVVGDNWWPMTSNDPTDLHITHSAEGLFHHVLHLLGHGTVPELNETTSIIVSQRYGQVIYPAIIEASTPIRIGYLTLNFFQGTLRWSGSEVSNLATTNKSAAEYYWSEPNPPQEYVGAEYIPERIDQKPSDFLIWSDQAMDKLRLSHDPEIPLWQIINGLSTTIFSPRCSHSNNAPAGHLGDHFWLRRMSSSGFFSSTSDRFITQSLLPVHGCGLMQLAQIATLEELNKWAVLHWKGCIACALKLAQDLQIDTVIC